MIADTAFEVAIAGDALADVYWEGEETPALWPAVEALDASRIRVLSLAKDTPGSATLEQKLRGCSGVMCRSSDQEIALTARQWGLPLLALNAESAFGVQAFRDGVMAQRRGVRRYAFYIGRLERDFALAREAIRAAVESAAGMDFLWIDDGRHATNVGGIRERTRLLIQHAAFVVADLTLGAENPRHENPSRAHEIGMALAYERPIFLSSQEPRRYPYFSIADMQMSFWASEDELDGALRAWIRTQRHALARRVLNRSLPHAVLAEPRFHFDASRRFVGPNFVETPLRVER